jgi:hypothetical protein
LWKLPQRVLVKDEIEEKRESDPDDRPRGCLAKTYSVRFSVKDAEIDGEEYEYETDETCVEPPVFRKRKKLNHTSSFRMRKVLVVELLAFPDEPGAFLAPC